MTIYAMNLGLALLAMTALWPMSIRSGDPSYVDAVWPVGIALMGVLAAWQAGNWAHPVTWLAVVWALRLGVHLFLRWRREGADPRYQALRAKAVGNVHLFTLVTVFLMQGALLWLVSLPVQESAVQSGWPGNIVSWVGLGLFALGVGFESVGDWQLMRFRSDPANKGQVMDRGLWKFTRHPNYFGDACVFWGLWLCAVADGTGLWTVVGPLFLTFTLVKWSGAALLERGLLERRPGYRAYVERTSAFIPWPPRKA